MLTEESRKLADSARRAICMLAAALAVALVAGCPQRDNKAPEPSPSPAASPSAETAPPESAEPAVTPEPASTPTSTPVAESKPVAEPKTPTAADYPLPAQGEVEDAILAQLKTARDEALSDPPNVEAVGHLAMLYQAYGRYPAAATAYIHALQLSPDDFRWNYLLGHTQLAMNLLDDAIRHLTRATKLKPDYTTAKIVLANAHASKREYREALEIAVPLFDANPDEPAVAYAVGSYYLAANEAVWAVELLKPLAEKQPQYGGVRVALAEAFGRLGQHERADEILKSAGTNRNTPLLRDPELLAVYRLATGTVAERNKAIAYISRGDYEQAIAHFEKSLSFSPDDKESRLGLSSILAATGDLERAESILSRMVDEDIGDTDALVRLGALLFQQDRFDDAKALVARAEESIPEDVVVLGLKAKIAIFDGDYEQAVALMERVTSRLPDDGYALRELAKGYAKLSRFDEAEKALQRSLELIPNDKDTMKALGDVYYAQGEQDAAMAWYRRAAKEGILLPPPAMATIATDAFGEGDYEVGLAILRRGVEAYPDDDNLLDTLSRALSMCPDTKLRNGAEAMEIARKLYGDDVPQIPIRGLVTLAAAHAELSDYDKAMTICSEGMQRALESNEAQTYHQLQKLLTMYRDLKEVAEETAPAP